MKILFWVGLTVMVLGLASLVVPIPRTQRDTLSAGGFSIGAETTHSEKVPPLASAFMILGGASMMFVRKTGRA